MVDITGSMYLMRCLAYNNNLRTRSLLSFIAVVLQIPAGWALQAVLDYPGWGRRKRGLIGLTGVCVPLVVAWVWEMVSSFSALKPIYSDVLRFVLAIMTVTTPPQTLQIGTSLNLAGSSSFS